MKVYLDNASTTFPKPKIVTDSIYEYLTNIGGNANRSTSSNSLASNKEVLMARQKIADFFNFDKIENVIFTNNITTSLNILIKGILKKGDHVLTSSIEHNSVIRPLISCKESIGIDLEFVKANKNSFINPSDFEAKIKPNTKLIVLTHASNVTGCIQPIKKIGAICKKHNIFFIIDTAQSAGSVKIDFNEVNASALAFTGHKSLLGPQGIGGFIISDEFNEACSPFIEGGTGSLSHDIYQPTFLPDKFESGTLNIPGIVGLSRGIDFINEIGLENIKSHNTNLYKKLVSGLLELGYTVYGDLSCNNSTTSISFNLENVDPSELSFYLDSNGISNRSGLHCAPKTHETIGTFPLGSVRLSISYFNTNEEIEYVLKILSDAKKYFY
ncbi:aminotransferase class V-fold PLP-dependent enzyme [Clostridium thermobutyricum]|uniref:cysteine desulfurase n=1 Tax=Clostridium thermobutyricum DSM 4928 TaxID=1121339 RepID=A0A1V4SLJ7_9CLOT|nr:aminotransferase class V-fold PLP-dependent enzyme [Clostridium thermobutyricum]OPX44730.1 cysteine desulfurase SufS [Clostridium thermobutyricum DSM 4928]